MSYYAVMFFAFYIPLFVMQTPSLTPTCVYRSKSFQIVQLSQHDSAGSLGDQPTTVIIDGIEESETADPHTLRLRSVLRDSEQRFLAPGSVEDLGHSSIISVPQSSAAKLRTISRQEINGVTGAPDDLSDSFMRFEAEIHYCEYLSAYDTDTGSGDASTDTSTDSDTSTNTSTDTSTDTSSSDTSSSDTSSVTESPHPTIRNRYPRNAHFADHVADNVGESFSVDLLPIRRRNALESTIIGQTIRPARVMTGVTAKSGGANLTSGSPRQLIVRRGTAASGLPLTPRYNVTDTALASPTPSAEEMNNIYKDSRQMADTMMTRSLSAAGADTRIAVTVLPATRGGLISVNNLPPTQARAMDSPLSRLNSRVTQHTSTASINFDTASLYETELSSHDKRDYIFETVQSSDYSDIATEFDCRTCQQDRPDGTSRGNHIALAIVSMMEINFRARAGIVCSLSSSYLYTQRRLRPYYGISAREALKLVMKQGVCTKEHYPWEGDDALAPPITERAHISAREHKIIMYARIASCAGLKKALAVCGACFMLLPLYRGRPRFWCASVGEDVPRKGLIGVQSAVVVGYTQEGFVLTVWNGDWIGDRTVILPWCDWDSVIECWTAHVDINAIAVEAPPEKKIPQCPSRTQTMIIHESGSSVGPFSGGAGTRGGDGATERGCCEVM